MDGAQSLAPDEDVAASVRASRGRRRRRSKSLNDTIRRRHAFSRVRMAVTIVLLGSAVIATSIYVARNSSGYEPVPAPEISE
jgi:hypothetical protein